VARRGGGDGGAVHGGARHGVTVALSDETKLAVLANEERAPRALRALFASERAAQRARGRRRQQRPTAPCPRRTRGRPRAVRAAAP
jgi:hypothetical protein